MPKGLFRLEDVRDMERTLEPAADRYILVVDDDPTICEVIQMALQDDGWQVETASRGVEAVEAIQRRRPSLVMLDLNLRHPGEGDLIAQALAKYDVLVPILVVSGDADLAENTSRIRGYSGHLAKPFDLDQMYHMVRSLISSSAHQSAPESRSTPESPANGSKSSGFGSPSSAHP